MLSASLAENFEQSAFITQLGLAWLAGLLTAFTPCVYPLVPVTLAIFGVHRDTPRWRRFKLALLYTLGIASSFTCLGIIAGKSGAVFGSLTAGPVGRALTGILFFLLGLIVLEVIRLKKIQRVQTWASHLGGAGLRGSFIMGLASGLVAAPCVGPVLILILAYSAKTASGGQAALLLFSYALGFSLLFLLLGISSGLLHRLPQSGNWLNLVKFIIALALFHFAASYLPEACRLTISLWPAWILWGLLLTGFILAHFASRQGNKFFILIAALSCVPALIPDTPMVKDFSWAKPASSSEWKIVLQSAREQKKPLLVDLSAEWCAACQELDQLTFSNPQVRQRLQEWLAVEIDYTEPDAFNSEISGIFQIAGLPAVLLLMPDGQEIPDSRISGFIGPEEMLQHLAKFRPAPR